MKAAEANDGFVVVYSMRPQLADDLVNLPIADWQLLDTVTEIYHLRLSEIEYSASELVCL